MKFKDLTPPLTSRVSCLSLWARQNFPAPVKIEQTMSHKKEKPVVSKHPTAWLRYPDTLVLCVYLLKQNRVIFPDDFGWLVVLGLTAL